MITNLEDALMCNKKLVEDAYKMRCKYDAAQREVTKLKEERSSATNPFLNETENMAKIKALQEALQEKVEANAALQRSLTQSEARFEGVQVELQMKMKLLHRLQTVHNDINFKGNHPDAEYKHSSDTLTYHDLLLESQEDIFNLNNQRIILLEKIELMATSTGHHDKIEKEMEKLIDTKTQEMQQVRFEHQQLKQIIMKMEAELKATEELKIKNKALETELAFYMVKAQNIQKIAQPIPPPAPLPTSGYGNEAMARLMENMQQMQIEIMRLKVQQAQPSYQ